MAPLEPLDSPSSASSQSHLEGPSAERIIYDATYFGRGRDTVHLTGLFSLAYDLNSAARALARLVYKAERSGESTRAAMLKVVHALICNERNDLLDRFAPQWVADSAPYRTGPIEPDNPPHGASHAGSDSRK